MKRLLVVALAAAATVAFVRTPAADPYRVVFDLTSRDTLDQKAVLRWIKETSGGNPDVKIEVVMYGKGFELVMPDRSQFTADVKDAMKNPNVQFRACAIALRNNNVQLAQLVPGVQTVPDGIREIVTKEQERWGYIKVVH